MKGNRLIVSWLALLFSVAAWAEELPMAVVDSISPDPEWYVAPEIPDSLRAPFSNRVQAPHRAQEAASCSKVEAILNYDIDSVLKDGIYYEYDANGNTISMTVWSFSPDGTMVGKNRKEYAFDASGTQTMTSTYSWNSAANDWKGTEKFEYVYANFAGERLMTSQTSYVWINAAWIANQRYTYNYDAAAREIECYEYNRNTTTNELDPTNARIQEWYDETIKTLEIQYTAFLNGQPIAGIKKELGFDGDGNKIVDVYYSSISNGEWVGYSKEEWTYNDGRQTLHQKYGWDNGWSLNLKEETEYEGTNIIRVENYTYANGVAIGIKKELTTYTNGNKTRFIAYTWSNGEWMGLSKEEWTYNTSGKQTLHEQYVYVNSNWSVTLRETNTYLGNNLAKVENYSYSNGVPTGTKKEEYTYASGKKTSEIVYAWENGSWSESSKDVWGFVSGKQTLHEQYAWDGCWNIIKQENTTYTGANITKIENYEWMNGVKIGTKKEEYGYTGSKKTLNNIYNWLNGAWEIASQEINTYDAAGNNIMTENSIWTDGMRTGSRMYTSYNSDNAITEVLRQDWSNIANEWVNGTRLINTYNEEGVNIMTHISSWNGIGWTLYSMTRTDIIKDAEGRELLNAQWSCMSDSVWVGIKKDTIAYTSANKPLYAASYKGWANGDWLPYSKSEYTYDAAGHQILFMQYEGKNGEWVNKAKTEQVYDAAGNQTLHQGFNWSKNAWEGVYKYEYTYDAVGRQTMQAHYEWSSGKWSGFSCSATEYDATGNIAASISFQWKNNAWVKKTRTENVYDAKKRVIEYTLKKWQSNKWVNSRHNVYVYDLYDRLISTRMYWWFNNEWALYDIDDKEYDLSNSNLRRNLLASWLDNELQSYSDNHYFYNCDPHYYAICFVDDEGNVLGYQMTTEGQTPIYAKDEPTKQGSAEFEYTFAGWMPELAPVTSSTTYTATFASKVNMYVITFKNDDGSTIDSRAWNYGTMPSCEVPTKQATDEYTYTFAGWDKTPTVVTGEATYKATFSATKNSYLVTFKDEDGATLDSKLWQYGATPSCTEPTKQNNAQYTFTFAGWDKEIASVTAEATYTATYSSTVNTYLITFKNGDETLQSTAVEYGATPSYNGATPYKDADAQYTYTYAGWDKTIAAVTGDATYTATFTETLRSYSITWLNSDNSPIDETMVAYGVVPTHADPIKANTAEYTYAFTGWDTTPTAVTGDATYKATFSATKNSYTVTFKNGEQVLQSTAVEYGEMPNYNGTTPTKPADAQYTYTFSGWDKEVVSVTGEETYTATFMLITNTALVTFTDGVRVLQSAEVTLGTMPSYNGATPTKPADAQYTYTFTGWDVTPVAVTGEATYTAVFDSVLNSYTVTFYYEDGTTVLDQMTLEYGETPSTPYIPSLPSDAHHTYTFSGWYPEIAPVTGDVSYTPTFTAIPNQYTVIFKNYNGRELLRKKVDYGTMPEYDGDEPVRPATNQCTYTFDGWTPELELVSGDAIYTAVYVKVMNTYIILFYDDDGTLLDEVVVEHGQKPTTSVIPTKEPDEQYIYTFAGWTPKVTKATTDATYTATYTATKRTEDVPMTNDESPTVKKVMIDGVFYILRGGHTYTIDGILVK